MIIRENLNEAVRSLLGKKQRTILALLGIVIGIGSVIAMVSVGTIVQHETLKQFQEMGTDIVTLSKSMDYGSAASKRTSSLMRLTDLLAVPDHVHTVTEIAPYASVYGTMTSSGKRLSCPALGVTGAFFDLCKLKVVGGRALSDLDAKMYYCVLSPKAAHFLRKTGMINPLGEKIVFMDRLFQIVGEIEEVPIGGMRPYEINEGILIPAATSLRFLDKPEMTSALARLGPKVDWRSASAKVTRFLQSRARGLTVEVRSAEELIQQMQKQMRMFTLLLGAIGSIALVVGGVGVMNVMLVSVSERRKEIGIRRALGAQQLDIQMQFLIESVLLCIVGGLLGIFLGVGASFIISKVLGWTFLVSTLAVLLGLVVSCAVGLFFGFYPARQASRLNPIAALRSD